MTKKSARFELAVKELDSWFDQEPHIAKAITEALEQFEEIYLLPLERFESERVRIAKIMRCGKRLLADVEGCSIRQLKRSHVWLWLRSYLDNDVAHLSRNFPARGGSKFERENWLARFVLRALVKLDRAPRQDGPPLFKSGPFMATLRIVFEAYGYKLKTQERERSEDNNGDFERALRRLAKKTLREFRRSGDFMTTQSAILFVENLHDDRPLKKDRDLTNLFFRAMDADRKSRVTALVRPERRRRAQPGRVKKMEDKPGRLFERLGAGASHMRPPASLKTGGRRPMPNGKHRRA